MILPLDVDVGALEVAAPVAASKVRLPLAFRASLVDMVLASGDVGLISVLDCPRESGGDSSDAVGFLGLIGVVGTACDWEVEGRIGSSSESSGVELSCMMESPSGEGSVSISRERAAVAWLIRVVLPSGGLAERLDMLEGRDRIITMARTA